MNATRLLVAPGALAAWLVTLAPLAGDARAAGRLAADDPHGVLAAIAADPSLHALSTGDASDGDPPLWTIVVPAAELVLERPAGAPNGARGAPPYDVRDQRTESLPEGDTPSALVFTPDGSKIVVAYRDTWNLVVYDAATREALSTIPISGGPQDVALSDDGTTAVTANLFEDTASIVDLVAGEETAVVPVGRQPGVVRLSDPAFDVAVVGNTVDGSLSVINITTESEAARIPGVAFVASISFAPEPGVWTASFSGFEFYLTDDLVVPDFFGDQLHFVNLTHGTVNTVPVADAPREIAITPDGSLAVVSHTGSESVISVVAPIPHLVTETIPTIDAPRGPIAINPGGTKAAFGVLNAARIADLSSGLVSLALDTASFSEIHTTADGLYALAIGFRGSLLDYQSESLVKHLNNVVSTSIGGVSPVEPRAAMVATTFGENMVVVNTNGTSGFLEDVVPSGPPPESDKGRLAALAPNGDVAVVTNILSDTASILDIALVQLPRAPSSGPDEGHRGSRRSAGEVGAVVNVGDRPAEVAFTPSSELAVVANLDSDYLSVIDVAAALGGDVNAVTNVPISTRAGQVEISPDGRYAYAAVVAEGDGVWRVNLETLSAEGQKLATGNMGGVGYLFSRMSGLTLSHDGSTLVACNSFDDTISIIDTASWSVVATVPVGDFPTRATFSPNDATIYVAVKNSDAVAVVSNAGALSLLTGLVPVGDQPFEMVLSADALTLYVLNFASSTVGVVDLVAASQTATYPLPDAPAGIGYDPAGPYLVVPTGTWSLSIGPGPVLGFAMRGGISVLDPATGFSVQEIDLQRPPSTLAFDPTRRLGAVPSPLPLPGFLIPDFRGEPSLPPFGEVLTLFGVGLTAAPDPAPAPGVPALAAAPNPASGAAELSFVLDRPGPVSLAVYDAGGRRVASLVEAWLHAGPHTAVWDTHAGDGDPVAPGVYFAKLERGAAETLETRVVLVP